MPLANANYPSLEKAVSQEEFEAYETQVAENTAVETTFNAASGTTDDTVSQDSTAPWPINAMIDQTTLLDTSSVLGGGASLDQDIPGATGQYLFPGATGAVSWPSVGSRVWVFFEGGNQNKPVYFAATQAGSAWLPSAPGEHVKKTKSISLKINETTLEEGEIMTAEEFQTSLTTPVSAAPSILDTALSEISNSIKTAADADLAAGEITDAEYATKLSESRNFSLDTFGNSISSDPTGTLGAIESALSEVQNAIKSLLGINVDYSVDETGKATITITGKADINVIFEGNTNIVQIGDSSKTQVGDCIEMAGGKLLKIHTGGGTVNQYVLVGSG
jgi:hypothetical protein